MLTTITGQIQLYCARISLSQNNQYQIVGSTSFSRRAPNPVISDFRSKIYASVHIYTVSQSVPGHDDSLRGIVSKISAPTHHRNICATSKCRRVHALNYFWNLRDSVTRAKA